MKKIIFSSVLIVSNLPLNAQVSIGKESINGNSTLLDFDDSVSNTKGIILPAVTSANDVKPTDGDFIFDTEDNTVKVYEDGKWVSLSEKENADIPSITLDSSPDIGGGVIIGADSSTAEGVLVLESPDKAMILPKVSDPHLNVRSPYPGMMCYDITSKSLAVFDGSKWYYWN